VRVSIAIAQGSTPRPAGTLMLVTQNSCAGTIGGGHLELEAVALARGLIGQGKAARKHFSLGPSLGQCCGGAVDLLFEVVNPSMLTSWPEDALRFTLALFGAGHVGRALVDALSLLPCRIIWIDEREQEFPKPAPANPKIELRCVDLPSAEIKTLPLDCFVIVTTHSLYWTHRVCHQESSIPQKTRAKRRRAQTAPGLSDWFEVDSRQGAADHCRQCCRAAA
jgi:xanthine dehydrogenase accessory factor